MDLTQTETTYGSTDRTWLRSARGTTHTREVTLDADLFAWFTEHGGMTRENGQRFRDLVLSRGASQDVAVIYRTFRGRDATVDALLEERGLR